MPTPARKPATGPWPLTFQIACNAEAVARHMAPRGLGGRLFSDEDLNLMPAAFAAGTSPVEFLDTLLAYPAPLREWPRTRSWPALAADL